MKLKKLLCTALLALSWCATSAAAVVTQEDIDFARRKAFSMAPVRGEPDGTSAARRRYYIRMRNHLMRISDLDFADYVSSPDYVYDVSNIPVLERYYRANNLNAGNFEDVVRDAIMLFDYLIAQTPQIAPN